MAENRTEKFRDKVLEANYGLWNSLLILNGIFLSIFSAISILSTGSNQFILYFILISCVVSSFLIIANYNSIRNIFRDLSSLTEKQFKNLSEVEIEKNRKRAKIIYHRLNLREEIAKFLLGIESVLIILYVIINK